MYLYIPPCRAPGGGERLLLHTYVLTGGCARAPQEKVAVGNGPLQEDRYVGGFSFFNFILSRTKMMPIHSPQKKKKKKRKKKKEKPSVW